MSAARKLFYRVFMATLVSVFIAIVLAFALLPTYFDRKFNQRRVGQPLAVPAAAQELHQKLFVADLLGMEGMHPLEGKLENIEEFYRAGFRMMAPVHFFDNELV